MFVRRSLLVIAVVASLLVAIVYVLAVRTPWGQHLDAAALRGRYLLSRRDVRGAQRLHTTIDIASVALFGGAILLVAFLRGRPRLAIAVAALLVGSLATSELLKHLLGRPRFAGVDPLRHAPSYPSGHTTIAMALTVGAIFVAPRRYRGIVAAVGVAFAAAIGCSLVVTASHRPSDTIGAVLIVTAWSAAVAMTVARSRPVRAPVKPFLTRLSPWMAVAGVVLLIVAFLSAVFVALAIHHGRLDAVELGRALVGAASAILGMTIICTAALLIALHDVDLDKPASSRLHAETHSPYRRDDAAHARL
jgi:membrane-associated phospholipid phosphatase